MATLEKEKLLKYLEHAIKLEANMVAEEEISKSMLSIMDSQKPRLVQKELPAVSDLTVDTGWKGVYAASASYRVLIGLAAFCAFCALIVLSLMLSGDVNSANAAPIWLFFVFIVPAVAMFFLARSKHQSWISEQKKKAGMIRTEQRNAQDEVRKENEAREQTYKSDLQVWTTNRDRYLAMLNKNKGIMQGVLTRYYAPDYIYQKYRNLPALTSICEYLTSGRCDELMGANGAYNLYESELRQNVIIAQLNAVLSNLEQIKQNQYMLYREMIQINHTTRQIVSELSQIKGYAYATAQFTALNAFYNGVTAANTSAIAYLGTL